MDRQRCLQETYAGFYTGFKLRTRRNHISEGEIMNRQCITGIVLACLLVFVAGNASAQQCPWGSETLWDITYCYSECGDYWYTVSNNEVSIRRYVGSGGDVVIPAVIDGKPVVGISGYYSLYLPQFGYEEYSGAFQNVSTVTSVVIPDSVTTIGDRAFSGCSGLSDVTMSESVTSIGSGAFSNCGGLISVNIPAGVASIGSGAFSYCSGLMRIEVSAENAAYYSSQDGVLYNKNKTALLQYPTAKSGDYSIPDSVTSIGTSAFGGCTGLTGIAIPDSVTSIGEDAFRGCTNLAAVMLGNSVVTIGDWAFSSCWSLSSVVIPDSVTSIGAHAFRACTSMTSVIIGNSVTTIGTQAFDSCSKLTSVSFGASVVSIGSYAFYECKRIPSIVVPESVTVISQYAFQNCAWLVSASFLGDAPAMGTGVFQDCAPDFRVCYTGIAAGFSTPTWKGYPAADCSCDDEADCSEGYACINRACVPVVEYNPLDPVWTWMSGSNTFSQEGIYGTKGIPDQANVPGARDDSISWADSSGNLWLFGGYGKDSIGIYGYLNDLWRYDAGTDQWTWVSGSETSGQMGTCGIKGEPHLDNVPGARDGSISWADSSGNLWLFGGWGYGNGSTTGYLNDLWRYDPVANMWTWVSGSDILNQRGTYGTKGTPAAANVPGGRYISISWVDSADNLWLFGGQGYSSGTTGILNDLWRYDPAANMWTWMSGSNTVDPPATYGTKGTPSAANVPGGRYASISWLDSSSNLWLFGGYGRGSTTGYLNDLWRYDPAANMWTWMSGSKTVNQPGTYGMKGTSAAANLPGGRVGSISWIDSFGSLWLFGGGGQDSGGIWGLRNDLWRYDPAANMWTWMSGANTADQPGSYGSKGTPELTNVPGARYPGVSWIDSENNLWLFGGSGYDSSGTTGTLNDLWRYEIPQCMGDDVCSEGYECVEGECVPVVVDNPPAITAGPYLAAGPWPLLPTSSESPMVLKKNYSVLWTFSDDFASCQGDCTHGAEYQIVGGSGTWQALAVQSDAANGYAWVDLPVSQLQNGTYAFRFTVTDCAGQSVQSGTYYFKVARPDKPPVIGDGPFVAAGPWPLLPTSQESPMVLKKNYSVLWTFSDDYVSCPGLCTHRARYKPVDGSTWTDLSVSTDPDGTWYAFAELPVSQLENGTYGFVFDVTDCAGQTTYSNTYYFKVNKPL